MTAWNRLDSYYRQGISADGKQNDVLYKRPSDETAPIQIYDELSSGHSEEMKRYLAKRHKKDSVSPTKLRWIPNRSDIDISRSAGAKTAVISMNDLGSVQRCTIRSLRDTTKQLDDGNYGASVTSIHPWVTDRWKSKHGYPDKLREQLKLAALGDDQNGARLLAFFYPEHRGEKLLLVYDTINGEGLLPWIERKSDEGQPVNNRVRVGLMAQIAHFANGCTLRGYTPFHIKCDSIFVVDRKGEQSLEIKSDRCLPLIKVSDWAAPFLHESRLQVGCHTVNRTYLGPETKNNSGQNIEAATTTFTLAAIFVEMLQVDYNGRISERRVNCPEAPSDSSHVSTTSVKGLTGGPKEPGDLKDSELRRFVLRCMDRMVAVRPQPHEVAYYFRTFYESYDDASTWEDNLRTSRMKINWAPVSKRELKRADIGMAKLTPKEVHLRDLIRCATIGGNTS